MYKNVFFDLDDTLYDFSFNSLQAYKDSFKEMNYERFFKNFDTFYEIFQKKNLELWDLYSLQKISKEELNRIRFSYPLSYVGVDNPMIAREFGRLSLENLSRRSVLMPYAKEILSYLKPRYNLYILSNGFKELQFKKMESAGIDGFFKDIILSEDINICKPNRAIFEYALKTTNSLRVESIMIGDNYEVDIQGAAGAGIDQIYYCKKERLDLPMTPTFYIRSLRELKIFL